MALTLQAFNAADPASALQWLDGLYEHSPWIVEAVLPQRPFRSLAQLQYALTQVVEQAGEAAQLALIRAHPELAGRAMVARTLTADSTQEQQQAGLTHCTPEEFERLQQLNAAYRERFGFPFVLAVRGPRGTGLSRQAIIDTLSRRLRHPPQEERAEALRNIHRIAQLRLQERFHAPPLLGQQVWDWHEELARHSEPPFAERGQLTVTYLTEAHRACARTIAHRMRACGMDEVMVDAVGNVVGRYHGHAGSDAPWLLTGSHYDTVRNAGKYDGRLGIFVPLACVQQLYERGERLPFGIELVAFAEEEGQRYAATFLGSSALIGAFRPEWLEQRDAEGITLREALLQAGMDPADIPALQRDPSRYLGFVEVHIEQGPVLQSLHAPLGVVTSINGSVRYLCEMTGTASHAGTTPMELRHDAALGVAELALYMEQRARQDGDSVATIGQWEVPQGSVNVIPGRCRFSLDLRAPTDAQRDALVADVLAQLQAITARRGLQCETTLAMQASAAPSDPHWQQRWERAVTAVGAPVVRLPSGAGHDAMQLHAILPQAMLFVRGENGGISHNPRESTTADDMQLAVEAMMHLLRDLSEHPPAPRPPASASSA